MWKIAITKQFLKRPFTVAALDLVPYQWAQWLQTKYIGKKIINFSIVKNVTAKNPIIMNNMKNKIKTVSGGNGRTKKQKKQYGQSCYSNIYDKVKQKGKEYGRNR